MGAPWFSSLSISSGKKLRYPLHRLLSRMGKREVLSSCLGGRMTILRRSVLSLERLDGWVLGFGHQVNTFGDHTTTSWTTSSGRGIFFINLSAIDFTRV